MNTDAQLVLESQTFSVAVSLLCDKCQIFKDDHSLVSGPYNVRSNVSIDILQIFIDAIGGATPELTPSNVSGLGLLAHEFGFRDLSSRISEFRSGHDSQIPRIMNELADIHEQLGRLQSTVSSLEAENHRLAESNQLLSHSVSEIQRENAELRGIVQNRDAAPADVQAELVQLKEEIRRLTRRQFVPTDNDPLNGIIAHLTEKCGGNVHDRNIVLVSSGPHNDPNCAKVMLDFKSKSAFGSAYRQRDEAIPHARNNWICLDFKNRRVVPTHYSIKSFCTVNGGNLKNWLVEVSLDGSTWVEVDHRENNSELNTKNVTRTFQMIRCEECRFIRLVNIGRNHYGNDHLVICSFEIFGSLGKPGSL
jgi:hypothetical protein